MNGLGFGRGLWRVGLTLLVLAGAAVAPARAADALDEDEYSAWVGEHAVRVLLAMQLPSEFTLGDLREVAADLGDLVDEARGVEPPPRFATAHDAYLAAMEAVERARDALETVVVTRRPAPELRGALAEASERLALGLRELRDGGVALPGYLLGLVALTDEPLSSVDSGVPLVSVAPPNEASGSGAVAPPATPRPVPSAPGGLVAPVRPVARDACAGVRGCAASDRLRVRVLAYGPVLLSSASTTGRRSGVPGQAASRPLPGLVALRIQIENRGAGPYVVRPAMLTVTGDEGRSGRLIHVAGIRELVPQDGLRLAPGESQEGVVVFTLTPPEPRSFIVRDEATPDRPLAIPLPRPDASR